MNSKTTGIWFTIAAALAALIYIFQHFLRPAVRESFSLLPDLRPAAVTSVQVIPSGALEIRADRTNGIWQLVKPIAYPAQPAAIESLLDALQKLTAATRINAAELRNHRDADTEFGFETPRLSLVIESGGQRRQLLVGNKTPPGDQVFLRVVGLDGAFVADADWLKFIRPANDWRDTALVDANNIGLDWIVLTNGSKVIELRRDATNHLWRMIRPFPARADTDRITDALQHLQASRVTQFVTDDAKADLTAFGLQPADLSLWLGRGTNFIGAVHVGKNLTNDSTQVFVKRERWDAIMATAKEPLSPWHGSVNYFRDSHLLELTVPVAEIDVRGETHFTLQQQSSNHWQIAGEKFPVDAENAQLFIKTLAGLRVPESGFVKDVVTAPDLPTYGLETPMRQIALRSAAGDTNSVLVQLSFGTNQNNEVFVRRADEDFVYAVTAEDFNRLPKAGWEFRERRIWDFTEGDVVQITLHQGGRTRQMVRNGLNKWSLAAGSQGIINPPAIEETAHRFGGLTAVGWVGRNVTEPEKFGVSTNRLQIVIELKNGSKYTVDFGAELPASQTALAVVTLDGERWAFIFPPVLYQFVLSYLTLPAPQGGIP